MTHVNSGHCLTVEEKRTAGKVVLGEFDEEEVRLRRRAFL